MLLPELLAAAGGRPGVFVELGALDGVQYSNTIMLERCFNWTGVLIEANPRNFEKLMRSGRRAIKLHAAVCPVAGFVNVSTSDRGPAASIGKGATQVRCKPLPVLMAEAGLRTDAPADLLSLDVEGSEGLVLASVPRLAEAFKLLLVEDGGVDHSARGQRVWRLLDRIRRGGMIEQPQLSVRNSRVFAAPSYTHDAYASSAPWSSEVVAPSGHALTRMVSEAACIRRHAGAAERLILASALHVAASRAREKPQGAAASPTVHSAKGMGVTAAVSNTNAAAASSLFRAAALPSLSLTGVFVEVIDPKPDHFHARGKEARPPVTIPSSVTVALEKCFRWRGVRLSLARAMATQHEIPAGIAAAGLLHASASARPAGAHTHPSPTLASVATAHGLGPRIDLVALNTDRVLSFLRHSDGASTRNATFGVGTGEASATGQADGGAGAGSSVGVKAGVRFLSLLVHWRGHEDGPTSKWTRCTACRVTHGFSAGAQDAEARMAPTLPHNDSNAAGRTALGTSHAGRAGTRALYYDRRLSLRHNEIRMFVPKETCFATPSPGGTSCFSKACQLHPQWGTSVCKGQKAAHYCPAVRGSCAQEFEEAES